MSALRPPTLRANPRRFPHVRALDGLRGLAALAVFFHHVVFASLPAVGWPLPIRVLQSLSAYGVLGVDLFFVLSGYLITSLLLLDRRRPGYFHNFYWKRAFRILPPLLLVLAISHILGWTPWSSVVTALLFIANLTQLWRMPENGPFWSLSIEEQFYLLWPAIIRKASPRTLIRLLLPLIFVPPVLRAISVALHHGRDHYTFLHCDGLAWGALLALAAFRAHLPWHDHASAALWERLGRPLLWFGIAATALTVVLLHSIHTDYGLMLTASGPLFAATLLYVLTHRRSPIARLLALRPFTFLGDISYMVYLTHAYVMMYYDQHVTSWATHPTEAGFYTRFLVILGVTLLLCTVSLHAFERPVGRLRRYFLRAEA